MLRRWSGHALGDKESWDHARGRRIDFARQLALGRRQISRASMKDMCMKCSFITKEVYAMGLGSCCAAVWVD